MRHFLITAIALVFGFFAAIALSHVPRGLTAPSDVEMGRVVNIVSLESTDSAVEVNGIRVKVKELAPYLVLPIPQKAQERPSYPLALSIDLTNNTLTSIQAGFETLTPELTDPDGQVLLPQRARNELFGTWQSMCQLLKPGESLSLVPNIRLSWQNNLLQLGGLGDFWYFNALEPGIYQLRFTYDSSGGTVSCLDQQTREVRTVEGLGTGRGVTNFVPLHIVQPVSIDSNTVEMDGIWFETVVPQRVLPIPANQPNASTPVSIGIRITNKTSTPRFFTYFDKLFPGLIGSDGKQLQWEGGRAGSTAQGCPLVQPGESVTFFWNAKLSWQNNFLQLEGSDSFGSFWQFNALKPGRYQVGIDYSPYLALEQLCNNEPHASNTTPLIHLLGSLGVNPLVEIQIVQHLND